MTKKEESKLVNMLFEIYTKGVKGEECDLTTSLNKLLKAINYSQCCTQLNAGFKIGDKVVSINGRVAEIIGFPKHGHARVRNDVGGGIWQPNITELKLHKSV